MMFIFLSFKRSIEKTVGWLNMDKAVMPRNFSWVEEGKLAGLGFPSQPGHFKYLQDQGISYLVSLSSSKPRIPEGMTFSFTFVSFAH